MALIKAFLELTKSGIILFALLSALAGYCVAYTPLQDIDFYEPILLIIGLYFVCAGSFALNQTQEWRKDKKMQRTKNRPLPQGRFSPFQGYVLSFLFILVGLFLLAVLEPLTSGLALLTVVLYNGLYTILWKPRWAFAAVPGAVPGAMPVVIGFSANDTNILDPICIYYFLIMFLWQMPHFWSLALKYSDDYERGGFPVLPAKKGSGVTLYQIGLYTFLYVALALVSPLFVRANLAYLIFVVPLSMMILIEFVRYFQSQGQKRWLSFFLWVNLSLIGYLASPVVDKWLLL